MRTIKAPNIDFVVFDIEKEVLGYLSAYQHQGNRVKYCRYRNLSFQEESDWLSVNREAKLYEGSGYKVGGHNNTVTTRLYDGSIVNYHDELFIATRTKYGDWALIDRFNHPLYMGSLFGTPGNGLARVHGIGHITTHNYILEKDDELWKDVIERNQLL